MALRWDDIDFQTGKLHVRRSKGGTPSVHPIGGRELRALRRLQREGQQGRYVFVSERLAPLSVAGYQRMVARAGEAAAFPFLISSHVLRHSCGYKLANDGRDSPVDPTLSWPQVDCLDGSPHCACARSVQGFLEGLNVA